MDKHEEIMAIISIGRAVKDYGDAFEKWDLCKMAKIQEWFESDDFRSLGLKVDGQKLFNLIDNRVRNGDF